jgi:hypothetical protein
VTTITDPGTVRLLLALDEFGRAVAGHRAAQDLLDDLALADALARRGVGPELQPDLEAAAEAIRRALEGPRPMSLPTPELDRMRDLVDAMSHQQRLATADEFHAAQFELAARRRGWVGSS